MAADPETKATEAVKLDTERAAKAALFLLARVAGGGLQAMTHPRADNTSLNDYQHDARRTRGAEGWTPDKRAFTWGLGIAGEAGEVADLIKKVYGHGHPLDASKLAKLKEELGDVLWYVSNLADLFGYTLAEIAEANVAKLRARYPDGFTTAASIARPDAGPPPPCVDGMDPATWAKETFGPTAFKGKPYPSDPLFLYENRSELHEVIKAGCEAAMKDRDAAVAESAKHTRAKK